MAFSSIRKFERIQQNEFNATIEIVEMLGEGKRFTQVNHRTNAGMDDFEIISYEVTLEDTP